MARELVGLSGIEGDMNRERRVNVEMVDQVGKKCRVTSVCLRICF